MKCNNFVIDTSIIVLTMLVTIIITTGPSNSLQIKNVNAQNPPGFNTIAPSQGAIVSNPLPTTGSNSTIPSQGQNINPFNNNTVSSSPSTTISSSNFTGSMPLFSPLIQGFKSSINYTLYDAIPIAEGFLGNGSITIAALTHPENGFIVYDIFALDPNNNSYKVIVDPGNGKILSFQKMSLIEMMTMLHNGKDIDNGIGNFGIKLSMNKP